MLTVRDSIHITASPEDVFAFMDEPARQTSFTPHLQQSDEVERDIDTTSMDGTSTARCARRITLPPSASSGR